MCNYNVYSTGAVKKACKSGKKVLVIADCRAADYEQDDRTPTTQFVEAVGGEVYPVISVFNNNVKKTIDYIYQGYTMFIEESLV